MSRKEESSAVTQEDKNNILFCMNKGYLFLS